MIPYTQTILGRGPKFDEPAGDCFSTAVASILELPQSDVPNFCDVNEWYIRLQDWLLPRGLCFVEIQPVEEFKDAILRHLGWHTITGKGARGCDHTVVGYNGHMVHDPHPSHSGLVTEELYGLFITLKPQLILNSILELPPSKGEPS